MSLDVEAGTMTASIAQQPRDLGAQAVDQARTLLDGRPVADVVAVEVVAVTEEHVGDFL